MDSNDLDQYSEDRALPDEQDGSEVPNVQSGGAQSKGITSPGGAKGGFETSPESSASPTEEDDEIAGDDQEPNFPARLHVTIEKHGAPGAMQIEAIAQDGMINIENVYYFQKAEFADAKTAEQDWARRLLYSGPPFGNLDQDLQVLLERYLDERGINTALALWVPEYIDLKEQREYQNWLSGQSINACHIILTNARYEVVCGCIVARCGNGLVYNSKIRDDRPDALCHS